MKSRSIMVLALAACLSTARADNNLSLYVTNGIYGNYVFRGTRNAPTALFSSASLNYEPRPAWNTRASLLAFTTLANDPPWQKGVGEIHFDTAATWDANRLMSITAGHIFYAINSAVFRSADENEVYAGLDFNLPGSPALYAYYAYLNQPATYLEASAGHAWDLGASGWSLLLSGSAGFYFGLENNVPGYTDGFKAAVVHTGLRYDLGEGWALEPAVDWWFSEKAESGLDGEPFRPVPSLTLSYAKLW